MRLDAVAYLWKEPGTNCINRPQTNDMVRLFRCILDRVAPEGILPSEEVDDLVEIVTKNNGVVSYKNNPDGSRALMNLISLMLK